MPDHNGMPAATMARLASALAPLGLGGLRDLGTGNGAYLLSGQEYSDSDVAAVLACCDGAGIHAEAGRRREDAFGDPMIWVKVVS